jgi:hypothetical protein
MQGAAQHFVHRCRTLERFEGGRHFFMGGELAIGERAQRKDGKRIGISRGVRRCLLERRIRLGLETSKGEASETVSTELRDSEVRHLRATVIVDQDIPGFQIAVHNTLAECIRKRVENGTADSVVEVVPVPEHG